MSVSKGMLSRFLRSFGASRSGATAIMFMLILPVLAGCIGTAIDLGNALRARELLLSAADAAALATIRPGTQTYLAAANLNSDGEISGDVTAAQNIFRTNLENDAGKILDTQLSVTSAKSKSNVTSTVTVTGRVQTYFMGIFGERSITVSGSVTAVNQLPAYVDFYLMLDDSPSMGLAATTADQNTLKALTAVQPTRGQNCAFACHQSDCPNATTCGAQDNYTIATSNGVNLRIDALRQATQQLMDMAQTLETSSSVSDLYRMSISSFDVTTTSIFPLSSNLASAKTAAGGLDVMSVPYQNFNSDRDTDYEQAFDSLNSNVPTSGSGNGPADPIRVAFIVTDGVEDATSSNISFPAPGANTVLDASVPPQDPAAPLSAGNRQRTISALNPSLCSSLKARGIKVAVIYTTFVPIPDTATDTFYSTFVGPWAPSINPDAQACASPGYFFEVSPDDDLSTSMDKLFQKLVANARLSS